jgi:putative glutamine amidotransferase
LKRVAIESPTLGLEAIFHPEDGFSPIIVRPNTELPDDIDLIVFSGGSDIHPSLYGQKEIMETAPSVLRDKFSKQLYAKYSRVPKVGVCRGAQFLCAMNGGSLWQDVTDHGHDIHPIKLKDGSTWLVNSVHHQACRPLPEWIHIARSKYPVERVKDDKQNIRVSSKDLDFINQADELFIHEAFYIQNDQALCVQWHPEFGHKISHDLFFSLLKEYLP